MAQHLNLAPTRLRAVARRATPDSVYGYVITSMKQRFDAEAPHGFQLMQRGSGPNWQGGVLTICTCKHQMRCALGAEEWPGKWIAGFTSRQVKGRHWLAFLTCVRYACESQAELWRRLPAEVRAAKSASLSVYGDLFEPLAGGRRSFAQRFDPNAYHPPRSGHRHEDVASWHRDIDYRGWGRRAALLVGDPRRSFLWPEPKLYFNGDLTRGHLVWDNLRDLLAQLETVE